MKDYSKETLLAMMTRMNSHQIALLVELADYINDRVMAKASGSIEFSTDAEGTTFFPKKVIYPSKKKIS